MALSPFPGMDPYLEHPALWPDFHNSLIGAIRDALSPLVAPRYYVALERRAYLLTTVLEVDIPMNEEVGENFLEVHEVGTGKLVTIIELLSPVNKIHPRGRQDYQDKRDQVFRSRTSLVEIDLLREGEPMPVMRRKVASDYRILVSRGSQRPRAQLYTFNLRDPIPHFPVPLLPGDTEPAVNLGEVLHALYDRARFDLRLDYSGAAVPPVCKEDEDWARRRIAAREPGPSPLA